jgi:hypothetical protein
MVSSNSGFGNLRMTGHYGLGNVDACHRQQFFRPAGAEGSPLAEPALRR